MNDTSSPLASRLIPTLIISLCLVAWQGVVVAETNAPAPAPVAAEILTPKPPATPRITGPKIFGVRPGNPFLFTVTATGDKPMNFTADNLPSGLSLDPKTGMITGTLKEKGTNAVTFHAKNASGDASRPFRIVCGDTISLAPALGWNSWNCFAQAVDDAKVRAAADAMISSGLADHGWSYINIDDCWQAKKRDTNDFILSNEKFPDMKALGEYIHSKGLKFGIYSSPGAWTCGGFTGSYQHEDKDAQRYGEWGVDYFKYDMCSYSHIVNKIISERYPTLLPPEYVGNFQAIYKEKLDLDGRYARLTDEEKARRKVLSEQLGALYKNMNQEAKLKLDVELQQEPYKIFRSSLDKVNRDIVYSFCQYGKGNVWEWGEKLGGNSWRTTFDITDTWKSMSGIGFNQNGHEKFAGPGHWNDPDMLIVGHVGWGPKLHPTRLTPDEQYTHMSLWALLSSPLLIGCDMTQLDDFTKGLLSNDEVLDVNQDPLGKPAGRISQNGDAQVWARDLEDGSKAAGLFNLGDKPMTVSATWAELGIK